MADDAPSSLLSLTGSVDDIILSYVSAGEGGVHSVLNLREVCSTTKLWVDTLRPTQAKRIFSGRQAKVKLSVERLEEFLAAPPPFGLTSLSLTQTEVLGVDLCSPEKEELWSRFVSFWATAKLKSLDVDVLLLPLDSKLSQLLSLESLRSLHCDTIKHIKGKRTGRLENLFRFETLHVENLEMGVSQKHEFYFRLSTQQNLKCFSVKIEDTVELNGVVDLIKRKKAAEDFKLMITMDPIKLDESKPKRIEMNDLYSRLVTSVANSSATIRIRGLGEDKLSTLSLNLYLGEVGDSDSDDEVEEEMEGIVRKFYKSIVGTTSSYQEATDFPNLETYTLTSAIDSYEDLEKLESTAFPRSLKKLQVESGLPRPASLPATLTHLEILEYYCSANELLQGLFSLSEECPSLRNLKLRWNYCSWDEVESDVSDGFHSFASSPFKGLMSLDFCAQLNGKSEIPVYHKILRDGFKLPQLAVLDLKVSFAEYSQYREPLPVVNQKLLTELNSGPVSKSLLNVAFDPRYVAKNAIPLLDVLKSTAAENKRKRVDTHGKERERQFNR